MSIYLRLAAITVVLAFAAGRAADAAIVVGLVVDPAMTAGASPDVSSIYSGAGTWHLFAVDDNVGDFGISTYSVHLAGATTIRNTSPLACQIQGSDGSVQQAGFNLLRSSNTSSSSDGWIHAAQPLPDQSPFLLTGLGQESGNLAAKAAAAQPGSTVINSTISSSWGTYSTISPLNGKNWLFLGEGTYDQGTLPSISQASFTVYNNSTTFSSKMSSTAIVPEPMTPGLLTPEYLARISAPPPTPPAPEPLVAPAPPKETPPSPPVAAGAPYLPPDPPPVVVDDPQLEIQPIFEPVRPTVETFYYDGSWVSVSNGDAPTGVDPGGLRYFSYQPIDSAAPEIEPSAAPTPCHGGLRCAMMTALTGLHAVETSIDALTQIDVVPNLLFASLHAPSAELTDRVSFASAVAAPEPATLALVGLASLALAGMVCRRRSR